MQEKTIGVNVGEESGSATGNTDVRFTTRVVGAEHGDAAGELSNEPVSRLWPVSRPMVIQEKGKVSVWNIALSLPRLQYLHVLR